MNPLPRSHEATLLAVLPGYRGGFVLGLDAVVDVEDLRNVHGMDLDMLQSHDAPDGDLSTELNDTVSVSCPYCGEASELPVDLAGGAAQEYVEDCEVCCQPWLVRVQLDGEGYASASVTTLDDE